LQAEGSAGSSRQPLPQLRAGDTLWTDFLATAAAASGKQARPLPHIVDAAAPSTILFSSGTTVRLQQLRRRKDGRTE
jgi:acyl-coenzyme A synthetase/AMP-(fatty) acid ligase